LSASCDDLAVYLSVRRLAVEDRIAVCSACRDGPCYRRTAEKVNSRRLILRTETLNSSCAGRSASLRALTPVFDGLMDARERSYGPRIHLFAKKDGLPDQVRQ